MKRQIRNGVFETNSSSMHSLVIQKSDEYYTHEEILNDWYIHKDGTISFYGMEMEFGRYPFKCLATFTGKLRYAIASLCCDRVYSNENFKEILETVSEILPEFKKIEVISTRKCNAYDEIYYGYIDHQSADVLTSFLTKSGVSLKEFLTNKKYIVIIDGDEYCVWRDLKESGLVDLTRIENELGEMEDYG